MLSPILNNFSIKLHGSRTAASGTCSLFKRTCFAVFLFSGRVTVAHHHPESLSSRGRFTRPFVARSSRGFTGKNPPFPWNTCHSSRLVGRETEAKHRAGSRKVGGRAGTVTVPSQPPEPGPLGDTVRERGKSCGMGEGPWLCSGIPRRRGERGCLAARMHERGAGAWAGCAGPQPESCPAPKGQAGPGEPTSASSSRRCQPVWNVKRPGYARRPRGLCGLRGWEVGGHPHPLALRPPQRGWESRV